jgi:hypothetical protein
MTDDGRVEAVRCATGLQRAGRFAAPRRVDARLVREAGPAQRFPWRVRRRVTVATLPTARPLSLVFGDAAPRAYVGLDTLTKATRSANAAAARRRGMSREPCIWCASACHRDRSNRLKDAWTNDQQIKALRRRSRSRKGVWCWSAHRVRRWRNSDC